MPGRPEGPMGPGGQFFNAASQNSWMAPSCKQRKNKVVNGAPHRRRLSLNRKHANLHFNIKLNLAKVREGAQERIFLSPRRLRVSLQGRSHEKGILRCQNIPSVQNLESPEALFSRTLENSKPDRRRPPPFAASSLTSWVSRGLGKKQGTRD